MPGRPIFAGFLVFGFGAYLLSGAAPAKEGEFRELSRLEKSGAQVSALLVDLETGSPIAQLEPRKSLTPASVTKALLAAAALELIGPEATFKTEVYVEGQRKGETIDGNLVILAGGDPGLTNEFLWRLSTDVARLGVRKVSGQLILDVGRFESIPVEERDTNRAIAASASSHAYDSPLSAGAVNFSVLGVFAAPGSAPGRPAEVALEPYPLSSVKLKNDVRTVAKGPSRISVTRVTTAGRDIVTASGQLAVGDEPRTVYRSISDPDRYALDVLKAFLSAAGVEVQGEAIRKAGKASGKPVLTLESQPLEWHLRGLLRYSNNFIGDMLTMQLGLAAGTAKGRGTLEAGNQALEAYVGRYANGAGGGQEPLVRLVSGSGLTPENKISAAAVVEVLSSVYDEPDQFGHLYAALPGAGQEGTLKNQFQGEESSWLQGRLRAKTGTLTEPQTAVGLAGYARTRQGRWVAFGLIVNGGVGVGQARSAIERDLGRLLGEQ